MSPNIISIAHRGGGGQAPENTLAAFRAAYVKGCRHFEYDVRLTRDNQVVIIHDSTVNRTAGIKGRVADLTFKELRTLDFASRFATTFKKERILSLAEMLTHYPDVHHYIELKGRNINLACQLATIVNKYLPPEQASDFALPGITITSFNIKLLLAAKALLKNSVTYGHCSLLINRRRLVKLRRLGIDQAWPVARFVTAKQLRAAADLGLAVCLWGRRRPEDYTLSPDSTPCGILVDYL